MPSLFQRNFSAMNPIAIGNGVMDKAEMLFARAKLSKRAVLFFDRHTEKLFAERVTASLVRQGFTLHPVVVPASEKAKSFESAQRIYGDLIEARIDRSYAVIAVGGGVVGDLAGFIAASFLRGLPVVQVPTTLLAMVDSAVGGKTAINHPLGKNLIGFFHQPSLVLIEPRFLETLPKRELLSGMAEVTKYALIGDKPFLSELETHLDKILALQSPFIERVIQRCVEMKSDTVRRDEFETNGIRARLNFGHTFGHAIEAVAGYGNLRHGEAVLLGMNCAAFLSHRHGLLKDAELERINTFLLRLAPEARLLKKYFLTLSSPVLADAMGSDKKRQNKKIRFVLLKGIGKAFLSEDEFSESDICAALDDAKRVFSSTFSGVNR